MKMNNVELECKDVIRKMKEQMGKTWKEIEFLGQQNEEELQNQLVLQGGFFLPNGVDASQWREYVSDMKIMFAKQREMTSLQAMITDDTEDNSTQLSSLSQSAWQLYKDKLRENGLSMMSIDLIEKDTDKIRKKLSLNTDISSVKGLVVGAVQSGKTASMGALISQAADNGWNLFIVVSGMIENLKVQTEERLFNDVGTTGLLNWKLLKSVDKKGQSVDEKMRNLDLGVDSKTRYLTVVLKNSKRLEHLKRWLNSDVNVSKKLKVLIIDDESDQGSVNTRDIDSEERTAIYGHLDDIVNGIKIGERIRNQACGSMNYVCYTATPYANMLNDSSFDSLYPNSFIATLSQNSAYIGPQQIFGVTEIEDGQPVDGLNIIRDIPIEEAGVLRVELEDASSNIPQTLQDAIAWFICCVAVQRYRQIKSPLSMLIHTSIKTDDHSKIDDLLMKWFKNNRGNMLERCRLVWARETKTFTKESFLSSYPSYELANELMDYPEFAQIEPYIRIMLNHDLKRIFVFDDLEKQYDREAIHLTVDNSKNNKLTADNEMLRIAYPDKQQRKEVPGAAFIVIGGQTLSRGLTIEGLVSTYFLRIGKQADTLMQMGRWFGYRVGYELLPRIWMDSNTVEQFEFLSQLDYDLREDLRKYMIADQSPRDVGPLINNTPRLSWLRITSKNKMQSVTPAGYDFTGIQSQTITFSVDTDVQKYNLEYTRDFLNSLSGISASYDNSSYVWKNVDVDKIERFLTDFNFYENNRTFNDVTGLIEWLKQAKNKRNGVQNWNVVLAGLNRQGNDDKLWSLNEERSIVKVSRTRKNRNQDFGYVNIGVLRSYGDNFQDITRSDIDDDKFEVIKQAKSKSGKGSDPFEIKKSVGIEPLPILVIYIIDKDSTVQNSTKVKESLRSNLNTENDLVGLFMHIPGERKHKNTVDKISINLTKENEEELV